MSDYAEPSKQSNKTADSKADSIAPTPAPKPKAAKPMDTTLLASAVLRDAAYRVHYALVNTSSSRDAGLVAAAGGLTTAFRTVELVNDEKSRIRFSQIETEVRQVGHEAQQLEHHLENARLDGIRADLHAHLLRFADSIERIPIAEDVGEGVKRRELAHLLRTQVGWHGVPNALDTKEALGLVRQAIGSASEQAARIRNTPSAKLRTDAVMLCAPIALELSIAEQAASSIEDRQKRGLLTADVLRLTTDLKDVAQLLAMTPKLPWKPELAQMFDGANALRRALGLGSLAWPYTGTIDPEQAVARLQGAARGEGSKPIDLATQHAGDPQVAVNNIATGLRYLNLQQLDAVTRLKEDLEEPPPPKQPTAFAVALEIAASVALSGVAGAAAGVIANRLKGSLEGTAKRIAEDVARASKGTDEARKAIIDRSLKGGTVYTVAAVDGAKDAIKAFLKDTTNAAIRSTKSQGTNSSQPRTTYIQRQRSALLAAGHQAELLMNHLALALGQVDLATLNQLAQYINGDLQTEILAKQYDLSLREWLNVKAHLEGKDVDPTKPGRDVVIDSPDIDGVLEASFVIDSDKPFEHAIPKKLVLLGGEHNASKHLKEHPRKLDSVGINVRYRGHFSSAMTSWIELGVGPDHGVQLPRKPYRQFLNLIAKGQAVRGPLVHRAWRGEFDDVSDADALNVARRLVKNMDFISTVWLES